MKSIPQSKSELETLMCINYGDVEEFDTFYFWTSKHKDFQRLCDRVGKKNLVNLIETRRSWCCEIPFKYWAATNLGIKQPRKNSTQKEPMVL